MCDIPHVDELRRVQNEGSKVFWVLGQSGGDWGTSVEVLADGVKPWIPDVLEFQACCEEVTSRLRTLLAELASGDASMIFIPTEGGLQGVRAYEQLGLDARSMAVKRVRCG